jgi:hypothetical protein
MGSALSCLKFKQHKSRHVHSEVVVQVPAQKGGEGMLADFEGWGEVADSAIGNDGKGDVRTEDIVAAVERSVRVQGRD